MLSEKAINEVRLIKITSDIGVEQNKRRIFFLEQNKKQYMLQTAFSSCWFLGGIRIKGNKNSKDQESISFKVTAWWFSIPRIIRISIFLIAFLIMAFLLW
ncbi:UNVERIFIED_CONTAM: hypothetical protein N8J90_19010 [Halobacillus marinus]